jgi:3D-(3,5/4)-trihydroxycyclohexane-1,2-dione acylhydrolase (decyclizing)
LTTVRSTVGQAIVRFMAEQNVERDGVQHRFIAGVWGIFGHGNVAGLGQALEVQQAVVAGERPPEY